MQKFRQGISFEGQISDFDFKDGNEIVATDKRGNIKIYEYYNGDIEK